MEYAYQPKKENPRTARARLTGINASFKDLSEVCRNVRGKPTDWALEFLEDAKEGKKAIYFVRHCKGKGHRRELGGKKGGWPVKSIKYVLEVLQSAAANANRLNLGETRVAHIIANKQETFPRMSPKGRRIRHDFETAFVEIVLEEVRQKADSPKKEEKKVAKPATEVKKEEPKSQEQKEGKEAKKEEAKKAPKQEAKPKAPQQLETPAPQKQSL